MSKALGILRRVQGSSLRSAATTVLAKGGGVQGLNSQWRGKSNAVTSVSSDIPSSQKRQKRISKEERHALVESYVNEYRNRNDGKFPTITDAQKHAGGGYYAVRKIVQELEYTSKLPSSTSRTKILVESEHNDDKKSMTDVSKFPQRVKTDADNEDGAQKVANKQSVNEDAKDTYIVSSGQLEEHKVEESYFPGTDFNELHAKKMELHEACSGVDPKDDLGKHAEKMVVEREDGVINHLRNEDSMDSATLEAKEHYSQSPSEPEESAKRKDDLVYSGESSFWGSLKMFADGIINIWRRK